MGGGAEADDSKEAEVDPVVLDQAWQRARTVFYDPKYRGVDWDSALLRYRPRAKDAVTQRELHEVVLEMLGELKASHTTLIERDYMQRFLVDGPKRIGVPQFGMTITRLDDEGYFISRILPELLALGRSSPRRSPPLDRRPAAEPGPPAPGPLRARARRARAAI